MKRHAIADNSRRKLEERRNNILDHHAAVEHKLMLHEMKKERWGWIVVMLLLNILAYAAWDEEGTVSFDTRNDFEICQNIVNCDG